MFTVQYGYGPRDIDAAVAELRAHPKPRHTEIMPSKPAPDNVRVYASDVSELFGEGFDAAMTLPRVRGTLRSSLAATAPSSSVSSSGSFSSAPGRIRGGRVQNEHRMSEDVKLRHEMHREMAERKLHEVQLQVRARKEQKQRSQEASFNESLASLNKEREFVDQIGKYLELRDEAVQRRQAGMHKDWQRKVFNDIQRQVQRGLDSQTTAQIERRRCNLMQAYLDISNRKNVVCDVVVQSEYDPFKYRDKAIRIRTADIQDPTRRELDALLQEKELFKSLDLGDVIEPRPRPMFDTTQWSKVRDTLHGRYSIQEIAPGAFEAQNPEYGAGAGPRPRASLVRQSGGPPVGGASTVLFDHFSDPRELARTQPREVRGVKPVAFVRPVESTSRVMDHSLMYASVPTRGADKPPSRRAVSAGPILLSATTSHLAPAPAPAPAAAAAAVAVAEPS